MNFLLIKVGMNVDLVWCGTGLCGRQTDRQTDRQTKAVFVS